MLLICLMQRYYCKAVANRVKKCKFSRLDSYIYPLISLFETPFLFHPFAFARNISLNH
jgi:hypothetical protein